jgi:hypothetical protein
VTASLEEGWVRLEEDSQELRAFGFEIFIVME